jgi:hypothetical protein
MRPSYPYPLSGYDNAVSGLTRPPRCPRGGGANPAPLVPPPPPPLAQVDDFKVDIVPRGEMLFFNNVRARAQGVAAAGQAQRSPLGLPLLLLQVDKPGVLKGVTAILGRGGVNIASFGLGRHAVGGEALGVVSVDSAVPADVLRQASRPGGRRGGRGGGGAMVARATAASQPPHSATPCSCASCPTCATSARRPSPPSSCPPRPTSRPRQLSQTSCRWGG